MSRPVIVIDLQGGCVHSIRSDIALLQDAEFVFLGDREDVSGDDKPVKLMGSYVYSTPGGAEFSLKPREVRQTLRQIEKYRNQTS